jgi:hypothetical protein
MNWRWLRAFPKFVLVIVLIVGSSIGFYAWWWFHSLKKTIFEGHPSPVEDIAPKIAKIESDWHNLLLVDNDLYDLESGKVIFQNWMKDGTPKKLFYDTKAKKFLAQYERGFVRYDEAGAVEATLLQRNKAAFSDDYKWAVYSKEKDIWRADMDWANLKFTNERKVTAIEQFNDLYLADNIILGTEKTLVVRNMNQLLRVNLETGEVHPTKIPLGAIGKRRSSDSKSVVGVQNGQFYCYDVDRDEAKTIQIGRGALNDYLWFGNDRCIAIAEGKSVVAYDRSKNTLTELVALPSPCQNIGEPSPDGRYAFCVGRGGGILVDTNKKTAARVTGGLGVCWISNDTFAFSREVPDSELRGTWLQTVGEGERRVSTVPYLVAKSGPMLLVMKSAGLVVFATKNGLSTMKADGTHVAEVVKLPHPPNLALGIEEWNR